MSYGDFVEKYMKGNKPVVLSGLMHGWRACNDWLADDGRRPNLNFFSTRFGASPVWDCSIREFTDQGRTEMNVSDYINYWLGIPSQECFCSKDNEPALLYLKDWHFVKEYPDYAAYTTPSFFADDWLNLYLDSQYVCRGSDTTCDKDERNCADYRFVYMGPKGTWTPLHADVFRSYSWSANICGKKLWYFLPPCDQHLIFDRNLKNVVYNICEDVPEAKFPRFKEAIWWECVQEQNDIIFVPSGWYHQVYNLEDTISINHNWFNAYNLSWVWTLLLSDYKEAKEYIEDIRDICDDFEDLCQHNLTANTGMNFHDFYTLLIRFALANSSLLYRQSSSKTSIQLVANLMSIRSVARNMQEAEAFPGNTQVDTGERNLLASLDVREILKEPALRELIIRLSRAYTVEDAVAGTCVEVNGATKEECHMGLLKLGFFVDCGLTVGGPGYLVQLIDSIIEDFTKTRTRSGEPDELP